MHTVHNYDITKTKQVPV